MLLTGSVSVKEETDAKRNRCREERKGIQINNGRGVTDSLIQGGLVGEGWWCRTELWEIGCKQSMPTDGGGY